jgi:hypothetical protein
MDTSIEMTATAETFSAVVATALSQEGTGFGVNDATYCGGGMARVHDD